jgi:DNA-binding NarL/FixJ family response regulator
VFAGSAQDHEQVLKLIRQLPDLEVVGAIQDASNVMVAARSISPDVLLVRISESSLSSFTHMAALRESTTIRGIVIMTDATDNALVISLLKSGVNAIIPADASSADVGIAITEALNNRLFIPPRRRNGI